MKRFALALLVWLGLVVLSAFQTHTFPALDTNNAWTGTNTYSNTVTLNSVTFANLPANPNGSVIYCSDCNATCTAGASTGRTCFRENGAWTH